MNIDLRFLLPDLLGSPAGLTNKDGEMIFPAEIKIPPEHFIFFISCAEWKRWKEEKKERDE